MPKGIYKHKPFTEEHKRKIGEANRNPSEETRLKLREARKKQIHPMLGKHRKEETKLKISIANIGCIPWNKGKTGIYTEETKKRISESLKKYGKGGLIIKEGYLQFKVPKGCRFSCMKNGKGYIPVHRLVMAAYLQRPLKSEEIVHHANEKMEDNRIENLELLTKGRHTGIHNKLRFK
ncbi:hypothetical protein ES708_29134 [subsurface metagenome]